MLTTGIFPDAFKVAKIIPIFKKGDSSLLVNYWPISLLPTISKVFERVIHDQMYEYFNNFNLLAEQQYGFRKKHSTEYAAIKLIDHVSKGVNPCLNMGGIILGRNIHPACGMYCAKRRAFLWGFGGMRSREKNFK